MATLPLARIGSCKGGAPEPPGPQETMKSSVRVELKVYSVVTRASAQFWLLLRNIYNEAWQIEWIIRAYHA